MYEKNQLYRFTVGAMFVIGGLLIGLSLFFLLYHPSEQPSEREVTSERESLNLKTEDRFPSGTPSRASETEENTSQDAKSNEAPSDQSPSTDPESLTEQLSPVPASLSGEEPISIRIKKLGSQFNDLNQKFVEKFRIEQEFRGLVKEHNGKGRRALIEELKRLQKLQIEAYDAGQHEVANEIHERSRQVNQNYGTSGKELVDTIKGLQGESHAIAKQMKAIKVELESLRSLGSQASQGNNSYETSQK
jgi:hypothetical protein